MESGTIADDQITGSSFWDEYHSPYLGRLHLDTIYAWPNHAGGWAAGTNDVNQWLQIDLGIEYNITRVATQGRQDFPHWVTKYNLQYSDDGVTFYTCVDEQGLTEVIIIGCKLALSPQKRYVNRFFFTLLHRRQLVDCNNERSLINSFFLSTSICSFLHCYLCPPRLIENHLFNVVMGC